MCLLWSTVLRRKEVKMSVGTGGLFGSWGRKSRKLYWRSVYFPWNRKWDCISRAGSVMGGNYVLRKGVKTDLSLWMTRKICQVSKREWQEGKEIGGISSEWLKYWFPRSGRTGKEADWEKWKSTCTKGTVWGPRMRGCSWGVGCGDQDYRIFLTMKVEGAPWTAAPGCSWGQGDWNEALMKVTRAEVADTMTTKLTPTAVMQTGPLLLAHAVEASLIKALCFVQSSSLHRADPLLQHSFGDDK